MHGNVIFAMNDDGVDVEGRPTTPVVAAVAIDDTSFLASRCIVVKNRSPLSYILLYMNNYALIRVP